MGIVAYCPNDHRVKVKDDLAGKKGICPTCGARFRIPFTSQPDRKVDAKQDTGPAETSPAPLQPPVVATAAAVVATPAPTVAPVVIPTPVVAPTPAVAPHDAKPAVVHLLVAEIVSLDAAVAATLPRALPMAAPG